jgi:hypothetical protein
MVIDEFGFTQVPKPVLVRSEPKWNRNTSELGDQRLQPDIRFAQK